MGGSGVEAVLQQLLREDILFGGSTEEQSPF